MRALLSRGAKVSLKLNIDGSMLTYFKTATSGYGTRMMEHWLRSWWAMIKDVAVRFPGILQIHKCSLQEVMMAKLGCKFQHYQIQCPILTFHSWTNEDPRLRSSKGSRQSNGSSNGRIETLY